MEKIKDKEEQKNTSIKMKESPEEQEMILQELGLKTQSEDRRTWNKERGVQSEDRRSKGTAHRMQNEADVDDTEDMGFAEAYEDESDENSGSSKSHKSRKRTAARSISITWKEIVAYAWLAAVLILYWVFYARHITNLLDADMSSEFVLGKLVSGGNGILSRNWIYSTEIRVLNNQIIYGLLFHFFKSWHTVRIASAIVLSIILLASFFYLCCELGIRKYFPYAASFLFMPFSLIYSDIVLMGFYYIPHIAISFLTIAMILHLERMFQETRLKYFWLLEGALALLSFLAGLGGPRQLIILYLPLLLASLYRTYQSKRFQYHGIYTALVFAGIGFLVNAKVLSRYFSFNTWTELNFQNFSMEYLQRIISGILASFGYTSGEIFSDALLRNAACFAILIAIALYYIYYFRHGDYLSDSEQLLAIFFLMNLLVYILIYNFTDMSYEDRYALPIIVFVIPILAQVFAHHRWRMASSIAIAAVAGLLILASSVSVYRYQSKLDYNTERSQLATALVQNGYSAGYATYWNGNIMTELSNGALEMYAWKKGATEQIDVDDLFEWLQKADHLTTKPEGKIFMLLTSEEKEGCPFIRYLTEEDKIYESENYVVYGFVDYESMLSRLSSYTYDLSSTDWVTNGETITVETAAPVVINGTTADTAVAGASIHSAWNLYAGAVTSGPNITLYTGTYYLTVTGEGLNYTNVFATSDFGENAVPIECIQQTDTVQVFEIVVDRNYVHCEFPIYNNGANTVRIDSVNVVRAED